ncbi:MAG: glycosyltransferase [Halanaerobiales bacterium]
MKKTLSLCMIAKNEAVNIARAIKSARDFVDEIIVVDTGSYDKTKDIAESLGANVFSEKWEEDFSKARNSSLEKASCDWILFMDCDEELKKDSGKKIKNYINSDKYEAYFIQINNKVDNNQSMIFPAIRLFKNRSIYRFEGKIHEQIINSILRNYEQNKIAYSDIVLNHYGYDSNLVNIETKIQRNLKILENYPQKMKNGFYFYNLATEYFRLGNNKKALKYFRKALEKTCPEQSYGPVLVKKTMITMINLKKYQEAIIQLQYYQSIYKNFADLYILEALAHKNCGRFFMAYMAMKKYKNIRDKNKENNNRFYPVQENYNGITAKSLVEFLQKRLIKEKHKDLSVCIIGKDEGDKLIRSIYSINEIADELIYFDTGSTDNSLEIAYQMGAKVFKIKWNNSYSDTKNQAILKAQSKWILSLNADEFLGENQQEKLLRVVKNRDEDGILLKVVSFRDKEFSLEKASVTAKCILFQNKGYIFEGDCEEEIISNIKEKNGKIGKADIQINHFHQFNDPCFKLKRKIKEEVIGNIKNNNRKNYLLAKNYFESNNFEKALWYFQQLLLEKKGEDTSNSDFIYYYTMTLLNLKKYTEVIKILEKIEEVYPDYPDLFYIRASAYYLLGNLENAKKSFEYCLEIGENFWDKYIISPGSASFKVYISLAVLYRRRKDLPKAVDLLLKAAEISGGLKLAILNLTQVFYNNKFNISFEDFLKKNDLASIKTYAYAASAYRNMGAHQEAILIMKNAAKMFSFKNLIEQRFLIEESEEMFKKYLEYSNCKGEGM